MQFRSGNPALGAGAFDRVERITGAEPMTLNGTVNKTGLLLILVLLTSSWTWSLFFSTGNPAVVMPYLWGGLIGGLVVALVTVFKKTLAMYTSPVYALLEGLVIGSLSAIFEAQYPGIVLHAVALTFGTLFAMLTIYRTRIIPVTQNFKMGIAAATGGIMLLYLATMLLGFFGVRVPYIHESGLIGIGFSVFVVTIAALNLLLDFDMIENGVRAAAPKYMEWYAAFALMVTLIWLYIEILRLLAKLRSRR